MADLIEEFKSDARTRGLAESTIVAYVSDIREFMGFIKKPISKVDRVDLREYVAYLRSRGLKSKTLGYNLAAVSSFFEFLIFEEKVKSNPVLEVRKRYLKGYKTDGEGQTHKIISVDEATAMVNALVDIRDKAILILLLKTGIRLGELVSLDVKDVNFEDRRILLKSTKKRSNRLVFFDNEAAHYLRRWMVIREERASPNNPALFISSPTQRASDSLVHRLIRKAALKIGMHDLGSDRMEDHFSAHCCRHWFTTHLRRAGMPREFIQELRGDVRREAIDIYDHIDPKELRESYLAHIPQLGI
ncbi:MAG: tyrosine-type recombinase/integrase [Methanotrichaceae archaeon]|nr:tyrosine-type recombinase/integrase [Methanotrichaceae archaeon]